LVFQTTFSVVLHFSGRFLSEQVPSPFAPLHMGQFSAVACPMVMMQRRKASD
jgi:hypothetical protein